MMGETVREEAEYAEGSGSTWPDLHGDPAVDEGAIVLLGKFRELSSGAYSWISEMDQYIGQVARVTRINSSGSCFSDRPRYCSVDADQESFGWACRDLRVLVDSDGGWYVEAYALYHLFHYSNDRWGSLKRLKKDLGAYAVAVEWLFRAGFILGSDGVPVSWEEASDDWECPFLYLDRGRIEWLFRGRIASRFWCGWRPPGWHKRILKVHDIPLNGVDARDITKRLQQEVNRGGHIIIPKGIYCLTDTITIKLDGTTVDLGGGLFKEGPSLHLHSKPMFFVPSSLSDVQLVQGTLELHLRDSDQLFDHSLDKPGWWGQPPPVPGPIDIDPRLTSVLKNIGMKWVTTL